MPIYALTSPHSSRASRLLTALVLALLFVASSACSVIVAGKLDEKPAVDDDAGSAACTPAAACDDRNACNGADTCSASGECTPGTMMVADGTVCDLAGAAGAGICSAAMCARPRCGDRIVTAPEVCDDANANDNDGCKNDCMFTCQRDDDCGDGNLCDGLESCLLGLPGMRVCRESIAIPPNGMMCTKPGGETGSCMAGLCM